jgi:RsiW-degrading membrane proteinase PrsW (M82 family)
VVAAVGSRAESWYTSSAAMTLALLLVAVVPTIALIVYFYLRDRYEPEPRGYVLAAFLYGVLLVVPAIWLEQIALRAVSPEWLALSGLWGRLYEDVAVTAGVEEGVKWLLFLATIARWRELDEPYDGLFYGATLALGFAAGENVHYVLRQGTWEVALLRGVFAVPAHALFGASMGYFVGRVKFGPGSRWIAVGASLLLPWALHGAYDLLCSHLGPAWVWGVFALLSLGMWGFVLWAIRWALFRSPFKPAPEGLTSATGR